MIGLHQASRASRDKAFCLPPEMYEKFQLQPGDLRPDWPAIQLSGFILPDGRWLLYSPSHPTTVPLNDHRNASTALSMNGKSLMILILVPFVLRSSKDERRILLQNHKNKTQGGRF